VNGINCGQKKSTGIKTVELVLLDHLLWELIIRTADLNSILKTGINTRFDGMLKLRLIDLYFAIFRGDK